MLTDLTIRNFAIIDMLDVEFGAGMTVLSGETGAGKSILVDALNLLLGDRADADAVRDGCERADLTARFDLQCVDAAVQWLREHELAADDECIIRRVVARAGRSRCWINGRPVPARDLQSLGEHLVDIHGQHAHQSLLRATTQRHLLDAYGNHAELLHNVATAAREVRATERAIAAIEQADAGGNMRIDLLRYQVGELDALGLEAGEYESITAEHKRLASAERLITDGNRARSLLFEAEEASAADQLGAVARLLAELSDIDPGFAPAAEQVATAHIQTQEAADTLRQHVDTLDIDPQRFAELENRLAAIQDLARKHNNAPEQLPDLTQQLSTELDELENAGQHLATLRQQHSEQLQAYREHAAALSKARHTAAERLGNAITAVLRTLGMPEADCHIHVQADADAAPSEHGTDRVQYRISANPGQAARPLERVASGGELSRISLAIEVVAAGANRIPTRVFDEVDSGIGGGVAEIVGRQLHTLGGNGQALCVTHLPQVAALADHHQRVSKQVDNGRTTTQVTPLDEQARIDELARMLGGVDITAQTRAHARDMLQRAVAACG